MATISTTMTGHPAEHALTLCASALHNSAQAHKRASALHRRAAKQSMSQLAGVLRAAQSAGVELAIDASAFELGDTDE